MNLRWRRKDEIHDKPVEKPPEAKPVEPVTTVATNSKPGFFASLFRRSPKATNTDSNANVVYESHTIVSETSRFSSKFLSDFTFKRIRGKGAAGCVFEVTHKHDNTDYAVKRIAVPVSQMNQTIQEVCLIAGLDHPGIVVYNRTWIEEPPEGWQHEADLNMLKQMGTTAESLTGFKDDAFIYIQMKLYTRSLADWLRDNRSASSRSLPWIKPWFKQIVSAVQYLHHRNIIHCDLKPSNILIDEDSQLKLCDLGLGTEREIENGEEIIASRNAVCSPLYMSPEQSPLFPRYSSKTDVFALGLILAEMLVVMSDEERSKNFDSYRFGLPPYGLFEEDETSNFVAWLAEKSSKKRPECFAILRHSFFGSDQQKVAKRSKCVRFDEEPMYYDYDYSIDDYEPKLLDDILYG